MILLSNALLLIVTVLTGAVKRWREYYNTVLLVSLCNLLYNFLCRERMTWIFHPEMMLSHKAADLLNTFVLLPATTILYLYYFPGSASKGKKWLYYILWVAGFSALEWVWLRSGTIAYDNEWTYFWSIGFCVVMFYILRLHHTHPGRALLLSAAVVTFLTLRFHIPLGA